MGAIGTRTTSVVPTGPAYDPGFSPCGPVSNYQLPNYSIASIASILPHKNPQTNHGSHTPAPDAALPSSVSTQAAARSRSTDSQS